VYNESIRPARACLMTDGDRDRPMRQKGREYVFYIMDGQKDL
jgi:hypothetical protein